VRLTTTGVQADQLPSLSCTRTQKVLALLV
jgi:hypothetical protein